MSKLAMIVFVWGAFFVLQTGNQVAGWCVASTVTDVPPPYHPGTVGCFMTVQYNCSNWFVASPTCSSKVCSIVSINVGDELVDVYACLSQMRQYNLDDNETIRRVVPVPEGISGRDSFSTSAATCGSFTACGCPPGQRVIGTPIPNCFTIGAATVGEVRTEQVADGAICPVVPPGGGGTGGGN